MQRPVTQKQLRSVWACLDILLLRFFLHFLTFFQNPKKQIRDVQTCWSRRRWSDSRRAAWYTALVRHTVC